MPVGFAGGLTDPDTGFVRFGWRDYDPAVGRFTAPDPLGDTGGDHDVYEYCVDDPVSMCDPEGLIPVPLLFLAGKALALGLGLGGAYMAASAADAMGNRYNAYDIKGRRPGTSSTPAWDGMNQIAPTVAAASAVSTVPGLAVTAPGPVIAAAQRGGAMAAAVAQRVGASAYGDKIITGVTHAAQLAEPFVIPGPPIAASWPGAIGGVGSFLYDQYKEQKKQNK